MTETTRIEIRLPRLGWSMEEGTFVGWLKAPGDQVEVGQPLFTLENDKATQDVEAIDAGILQLPENPPQSGQTLPVGALLGFLIAEGGAAPRSESPQPAAATNAPSDAPQVQANAVVPSHSQSKTSSNIKDDQPNVASPRARRLADQYGVNLGSVIASGTSGRIAEKDVRAVLAQSGNMQFASSAIDAQPISAFRRTIAERMLASQQLTAPVTLISTIDAGNLVTTRSQMKAQASDQPVPSYSDIIIKHCARALGQHPLLASRWQDNQVIAATSIDIGFAVDTEYGLAVPVIRAVDQLSLAELAARSRQLITAALDRRLQSKDVEGGVFTVTNLGGFGIDTFTPIINYPQCAILGLGAITRQPIVMRDGTLGVGWRLTLSLTFDHRIVDGAPAARFLQTLRAFIEE